MAAVAVLAASPGLGWWFPQSYVDEAGAGSLESVNPLGREIDHLFYVILVICGVVFVLTQIGLAWALFGAAGRSRARYLHGNHVLEVVWTLIPAAALFFIAFYQMGAWAKFRVESYYPEGVTPVAEVTARMYEWRIRYPAPGKPLMDTPQPDDLYAVNELLIPAGQPVLIQLRSEDVQHSFSLPQFRIKQDALPGQRIPVWFQADVPGEYVLLCQELCGWGHYKMGGVVKAAPPEEHAAAMAAFAAERRSDGVTVENDEVTAALPDTDSTEPGERN
ncbi:cytochrome c oxidase subunit II [Alienimonas californiensis]|uniref:cytochrome c oxidase subunit II n=1 Tax=Alienimonas californiensis TaxID=2527989 RepID=UPI001F60762D|nr:cytochrome c oxidase subunit II [Alienimonas californiensis]